MAAACSLNPGGGHDGALDWKDGRLVGLEILNASRRLYPDLLDQAEIIGWHSPRRPLPDLLPFAYSRERRQDATSVKAGPQGWP